MLQTLITSAATMIVSLTITMLFNGIVNFPKKKRLDDMNKQHDIDLLKQGVQALLKNELKVRYDYWLRFGYAPEDAKDDLEQEYQVYHSLGKNGVMDERRAKFLQLPDSKQDD